MKRREFMNLSGLGILAGTTASFTEAAHAAEAEALAFKVPPYLQEPSPTTMTIMWLLNTRDSLSWVEYGQGDTLDQKATTPIDGLIDADDPVHKVRLTELQPGTRYGYKAVSREIKTFQAYKIEYGETLESETHHFITPEENQEEVSCVIFNDIHENVPLYNSLHKLAAKEAYDFAIFNGDIMNHIDDESQLVDRALDPIAKSLGGTTPYVYTRGNHDIRGRYARRLNDYIASPGDANYYSFTYGPVHFLVMDLGEDKPDDNKEYGGLVNFGPYREAQREWLEKEIKTKACKKAAFRVLIAHIPLYGKRYTETTCKNLWGDLLNEGNVDVQLAGHTHRYELIPRNAETLDFPIMIGGAPKAGLATLMRITADRKRLTLTMTRDDGEVLETQVLEA
jgi:predicted phosphodiesterase